LQIDSGCDTHMLNDHSLFNHLQPTDSQVCVANGTLQPATGVGTAYLHLRDERDRPVSIALTDTLYVPELKSNLLSVGRLSTASPPASFDFINSTLTLSDNTTIKLIEKNKLYYVSTEKLHRTAFSTQSTSTYQDHMRMGHPGKNKAALIKKYTGIDCYYPLCTTCPIIKSASLPFSPTLPERRATTPLQRVHADLTPYRTVSIKGHRHLSGFRDQATGFIAVYPIRNKSDAYSTYLKFKQEHGIPSILRTDNEYDKHIFKEDLLNTSTKREFTCPYTSEQNADIESAWRVIHQLTRANLHQSSLPACYWPYAVKHASLQLNCWPRSRQPTVELRKENEEQTKEPTSPFEDFKGYKPRLEILQPFGCKALVHLRDDERADPKLSERAFVGIYLGNSAKRKGYKILIPTTNKIIKTRNVKFKHTDFSLSQQVTSQHEDEDGNIYPEDFLSENEDQDFTASSTDSSESENEEEEQSTKESQLQKEQTRKETRIHRHDDKNQEDQDSKTKNKTGATSQHYDNTTSSLIDTMYYHQHKQKDTTQATTTPHPSSFPILYFLHHPSFSL